MYQRGFSYLFVIFFVALISVGMLAGSALEQTESRRDKERDLLVIGHQFRAALASYVQAGGNTPNAYPSSFDDLVEDKRTPGIRRHLRKVFVDPLTGTSDWGLIYNGDRIVGIYSKADGVPLKQAGFENDDAGFSGARKYSDWVFTWPLQSATAK